MTSDKSAADARIERWSRLAAQEPGNKLHQFALAGAYLQAARFGEGAQAYGRCLELDPGWMVAAIKQARCLIELRRFDEARTALDLGARLAIEQGHDEPFAEIRALRDQLPGD